MCLLNYCRVASYVTFLSMKPKAELQSGQLSTLSFSAQTCARMRCLYSSLSLFFHSASFSLQHAQQRVTSHDNKRPHRAHTSEVWRPGWRTTVPVFMMYFTSDVRVRYQASNAQRTLTISLFQYHGERSPDQLYQFLLELFLFIRQALQLRSAFLNNFRRLFFFVSKNSLMQIT